MTMWARRVILGRSGLEVSRLGFGTEHIVHYSPATGGELLASALGEYGVNFWDTAPPYGSQPHVAAGLRLVDRSRVVVASKTRARTAAEAEAEVGAILAELGTPYLDLCLLHYVKTGELAAHAGALSYLVEAKRAGVVRSVGLSAHSPAVIAAAAAVDAIDVVCGTVNRSGSRIDDGSLQDMLAALARAHAAGQGVYAIKVLGCGDELPDLRGAVEFVLGLSFVHVLNIGMRDLEQVRTNLAVICGRLGV